MSEAPIIINASQFMAQVKKLPLPKEVMNKIIKRALVKTARWGQRQVIKILSKSTKVSSRILKGRMALDIKSAEQGHASIWIGLNPIGLHRLGPRQTTTGIKAGRTNVSGGFISKDLIFKRRGKNRLPIDKQKLEIYEHASPAFSQVVQEIEAKLQENFEQSYEEIAYQ